MSGDIDSRASDGLDVTTDAPGANDNASGMAGTIEAARVLSKHRFGASIVFAGFSGEEQGLLGGKHMAQVAKAEGWNIEGVLNNDMISNIEGIDGVIENNTFRVFSEPTPVTETEEARQSRRFTGGEVDGPSRQLARYVARVTDKYIPNLDAIIVYRLDRFGRGGHHRPFNDEGFTGVRIMETHENYNRQHQDIRVEDGIHYGDVIEGCNFDYAAKLTAANAATLAGLAWAPAPPANVLIGGVSTTFGESILGSRRSAGVGWIQNLLERHHRPSVDPLSIRRQGQRVHPRGHHHRQLPLRSRRGRQGRQRECGGVSVRSSKKELENSRTREPRAREWEKIYAGFVPNHVDPAHHFAPDFDAFECRGCTGRSGRATRRTRRKEFWRSREVTRNSAGKSILPSIPKTP